MCGGCEGKGSFSTRCISQPGSMWKRLADKAEDLADHIGSNDPAAANAAYLMAGRFEQKWYEAVNS